MKQLLPSTTPEKTKNNRLASLRGIANKKLLTFGPFLFDDKHFPTEHKLQRSWVKIRTNKN